MPTQNLKSLLARAIGLRTAMEAVMAGTTEDHAKWTAVNSYVIAYTSIAREFNSITGETTVVYDISNLKSAHSMVWPSQKAKFDAVFANLLMLIAVAQSFSEPKDIGPIYNLIVSASESAWAGQSVTLDVSRCVREYTSPNITELFGAFDESSVSVLTRAPCLFAFEKGINVDPKFGFLTAVTSRQGQCRLDYKIIDVKPFLTYLDLDQLYFELDISKNELYRTHWAIKAVNLPKELHARGITLPSNTIDVSNAVDIESHVFDVALSFPGEVRTIVEAVSVELERILGPNRYFYDNNYRSQLARPSLDLLLQNVYSQARLDVVFIGSDYEKKNWCGVEFRAIRDIVFRREHERVMYFRTDDGEVSGVTKTDGYIDVRGLSPRQIAEYIVQRLSLLVPK